MTKEEKEEICDVLVWVYKEGVKAAIENLKVMDKVMNEEQLQATMRKIMEKHSKE